MHGKRVIILAFLKFVCFLIPMWQELMEEAALLGFFFFVFEKSSSKVLWICKWVKVWVMHNSILLILWIGRLCFLIPRKSYATGLTDILKSNYAACLSSFFFLAFSFFAPLTFKINVYQNVSKLWQIEAASLSTNPWRWEIF